MFYVNIKQPDNQGSTVEIAIDHLGVSCSVKGDVFTFKGNGKTASFIILGNAQIIVNRTEEGEVISTFTENGGLQVKCDDNIKLACNDKTTSISILENSQVIAGQSKGSDIISIFPEIGDCR